MAGRVLIKEHEIPLIIESLEAIKGILLKQGYEANAGLLQMIIDKFVVEEDSGEKTKG